MDKVDILYRIEQMIKKEKEHLKMLVSQPKSETINGFIENSEWYLAHYGERLKEYEQYFERQEKQTQS